MQRLASLALVVVLAALLGGCGSSDQPSQGTGTQPAEPSDSSPAGASARACREADPGVAALRATGATCTEARHVMLGWRASAPCKPPAGASRSGCPALSYRCLATASDRGWSVSCAKPGRSIAFTVRRD